MPIRNANGHERIPRRPPRKHFPGLPLRRAMFITTPQNEASPEPGTNTLRMLLSRPPHRHYGDPILICPILDTGSGLGRVDPTPGCAAATFSNALRDGHLFEQCTSSSSG